MRCLQEVIDTLNSEGLNLDQHEIQSIRDVIESFRSLERSAREQQEAAQHLSQVYHELQGTHTSLGDFAERMDRSNYKELAELDAAVKQLLMAKGQLQSQHLPQLCVMKEELQKFALGHQEVCVDKLKEDVVCARLDLEDSLLRWVVL